MDRYKKHFNSRLDELKAFYKKEQRWPSATAMNDMERSLGIWCHKLRVAHNKETLDDYRRALLTAISFPMHVTDETWNSKFDKLKEFIKQHKALPSYGHELYRFAGSIKRHFNNYPAGKKARVKAAGFFDVWEKRDGDKLWEKNLKKVKQFIEAFRCLPTRSTDRQLEYWVNNQRQNLKKGLLNDEKQQQLKEAGIDLLAKSFERGDNPWQRKFETLKVFLEKKKRLPNAKNKKEFSLFGWLLLQARKFSQDKLSQQETRNLKSLLGGDLPHVFSVLEYEHFDTKLKVLKAFRLEYGRWPESTRPNLAERKLARWCSDLRSCYLKNKLSSRQTEALLKIDFPFDTKLESQRTNFKKLEEHLKTSGGFLHKLHPLYYFYVNRKAQYNLLDKEWREVLDRVTVIKPEGNTLYRYKWDERFDQLIDFIRKNNRLPLRTDDPQMRLWWETIRNKIIKGNFPEEKVRMLEEVNIQRPIGSGLRWENCFIRLKIFVEENKRWPRSLDSFEKELNAWCYRQRYAYRDGKLSNEQVDKLNSINFPWVKPK